MPFSIAATRIRFAVYSNAASHQFALYAGVIQTKPPDDGSGLESGILLRYDNLVGGMPTLIAVNVNLARPEYRRRDNQRAQPGQPGRHRISRSRSIRANPYTVFVGGDMQPSIRSQAGNISYDARIFRINTSGEPRHLHPR